MRREHGIKTLGTEYPMRNLDQLSLCLGIDRVKIPPANLRPMRGVQANSVLQPHFKGPRNRTAIGLSRAKTGWNSWKAGVQG